MTNSTNRITFLIPTELDEKIEVLRKNSTIKLTRTAIIVAALELFVNKNELIDYNK